MPVYVKAHRRGKSVIKAYQRAATKGGNHTMTSREGQQRMILLASMRKRSATSMKDKRHLARKHLYLKQVANGTHRF